MSFRNPFLFRRRDPFVPRLDLLYIRLNAAERILRDGVLSASHATHFPFPADNNYMFEVEVAGLRCAQYYHYPVVIDDGMVDEIHEDLICEYEELVPVIRGETAKIPLSNEHLCYLHLVFFKHLRAIYEQHLLDAEGNDEQLPRLWDEYEGQQLMRERIRMRRRGWFPPLVDEPWPPAASAIQRP